MDLPTLETVRVALADGIAEVTISRPKALNALSRQVLEELELVLDRLAAAHDLRCVILTGDGDKAFVAGADIAAMSTMTSAEADAFAALGHRVFRKVETLPVPVIAAVNGFALGGGCELSLCCDMVYASARAKFGQPEVKLGLIPGFGGSVRLARKVGLGVASEWIYAGEIYGADVAAEVGLVLAVYAPEELMPKVRELAKSIAKRAPLAVRAAKSVMVYGLATDPTAALALERASFGGLFASADVREGTGAFLAKREPSFQGK